VEQVDARTQTFLDLDAHPRPWNWGEFHASFVPRVFYSQEGLDIHAGRIQRYIESHLPHVKNAIARLSPLDGVANKYVNWRVYVLGGPFKAKFGRIKAFSHSTATVELESMASYGSAVQTVKRVDLIAWVFFTAFYISQLTLFKERRIKHADWTVHGGYCRKTP